jgi:hypothetical protein
VGILRIACGVISSPIFNNASVAQSTTGGHGIWEFFVESEKHFHEQIQNEFL